MPFIPATASNACALRWRTIKKAILPLDAKRFVMAVLNRTLHIWHTTLRNLCDAFKVNHTGHKCEMILLFSYHIV